MTTAMVTGGNKGIGLAVVAGLAEAGCTVYLGSRDAQRGRDAASAVQGDVRPLLLDVTSDEQVAAAAELVRAEVGTLDVLVNNAGTNVGYHRPADESADDLAAVYAVNVFAVVRVTNAFLPLLLTAPAARIVNVTSKRGSIGEPGAWVGQPSMAYSSSKTALNAITAHYARDLAESSVLVNGAAPGHVATDFNGFRGSRTPEQGAAVVLRLAMLGPEGPTGRVFEDDTQLAW